MQDWGLELLAANGNALLWIAPAEVPCAKGQSKFVVSASLLQHRLY
jgi:hypothetical protein